MVSAGMEEWVRDAIYYASAQHGRAGQDTGDARRCFSSTQRTSSATVNHRVVRFS